MAYAPTPPATTNDDRVVEIYTTGQDVDYVEIFSASFTHGAPRHTLRVSVRSNSYESQSYAVIDRWDGTQWQNVHRIPGNSISTAHKLYVVHQLRPDDITPETFKADRDELVRIARAVLCFNH